MTVIKKGQVFELEVLMWYGQCKIARVIAQRDTTSAEIEKLMSQFADNEPVRTKYCENECSKSTIEDHFMFCPHCGEELLVYREKNTLSKFIQEHKDVISPFDLISIFCTKLGF